MSQSNLLINNFNTGEVSGLVESRSDVAKYSAACITLENAVPLVEGGAKKMPGTYFAGATANGGSLFTAHIDGTTMTVTAVNYGVIQIGQTITGFGVTDGTTVIAYLSATGETGTYTISPSQIVFSESMQIASSGQSRLVSFQFSTTQGAVLELSAGIIRVWEGASQGSWSLGLAQQVPTGNSYNPATLYVANNSVSVGPTLTYGYNHRLLPPGHFYPPSVGQLYISAPYGTTNANTVPVFFDVSGTDVLIVFTTGTSPNQGIGIAFANATPSKNSASNIQTALRAIISLNNGTDNFIDLSQWTVTPDSLYFSNPFISPPIGYIGAWSNASWVALATFVNQNDQFPLVGRIFLGNANQSFNAPYWELFDPSLASPVQLQTPYLEADLFNLDCSTQSADVLWIFHPNYPPAVVERLSSNLWSYSLSLPGNVPGAPAYRGTLGVVKTGYSALGQNISLISQSNPCIVVLSSSPSNQPFQNGDRIYINMGSGLVELNQGEFFVSGITFGPVSIPVIDSTGASSTIPGNGWSMNLLDPSTGAIIDSSSYLQYAGGAFAVKVYPLFTASGDYPSCGTLYNERLIVGGSINNPTQINGSVEDDYPDFICDPNEDDHAFQFTMVSNTLDQILNMIGSPNALILGTAGGVWVVQGSNSLSLSSTNVSAQKQSGVGVSNLQPQLVGGSAIFVSRSTRIVTFLSFDFVTNLWNNNDLTRLNRNITLGPTFDTSGINQTAFQAEPYPIFWGVRADGQLIGLVFNKTDEVMAWFRINLQAPEGVIESQSESFG
jgi:hypothetical protein